MKKAIIGTAALRRVPSNTQLNNTTRYARTDGLGHSDPMPLTPPRAQTERPTRLESVRAEGSSARMGQSPTNPSPLAAGLPKPSLIAPQIKVPDPSELNRRMGDASAKPTNDPEYLPPYVMMRANVLVVRRAGQCHSVSNMVKVIEAILAPAFNSGVTHEQRLQLVRGMAYVLVPDEKPRKDVVACFKARHPGP